MAAEVVFWDIAQGAGAAGRNLQFVTTLLPAVSAMKCVFPSLPSISAIILSIMIE